MKAKNVFILIGLFIINLNNSISCFAQNEQFSNSGPMKLSGPRFGITIIGGKMADKLKEDYSANPLITQFGWQFEWRFFSAENGPTGVVECVPLLGGLEQGLFLPSLTAPIGIRLKNGVEFGAGPNVSVSGFSIVIAAGITLKVGQLYLPINISLLPSKNGARFSLLFGFNIARN
jgi:hypothetical protein